MKYRVVELLSHPHYCVMDDQNVLQCWCPDWATAHRLCALMNLQEQEPV